jgi:hypothetical protein
MGNAIKVVTHKRNKNGKTVCGLDLFEVKKTNATFKGVTCGRCLRVKNKRVVKTTKRPRTWLRATSAAKAYSGVGNE